MAEKKILNLLEEEKLAEKVRNYTVLYDKSHKNSFSTNDNNTLDVETFADFVQIRESFMARKIL